MKSKLLIYALPVMLTVFLIYGYGIQDNPFTDLSQTEDFNAGLPIYASTVGDSCHGTGQEKHDDGSFENGGGWLNTVTDGRMLTKFTPSSYPWKYNKFCIAMTRTAASNPNDSLVFDILVYDASGAGETPGVIIDSLLNVVARPIPIFAAFQWYSYDISGLNGTLVNSGSIYIGYRYNATNQASKFVMIDQGAATPLWPGYYSSNGGAWTIATTAWANYKAFGMRTMGETPSTPVGNTLVIYNDSTGTTTQRTADRDTLRKYVNIMIDNVTYMTKNTTTVFPDLSSYSTIIFQETSFDAVAVRDLTAAQRTAIKNWLATGTPTSKKSLIMIGADMGYSYSRAGSAAQDLELSGTYGGFQYINDNAAPTGFNGVAKSPPGTHFDALSTTPPGGSYWPDGCRTTNGGAVFNRYLGRSTGDTLAGISNTGAGWNVISTFQDPRYYTGLGDDAGTGYRGFNRVLNNMVKWVLDNQGVITNVNPGIVSTIVDTYELAQNYPNPFNPATTINFSIPKSGLVTLKIYDLLGKEVATLVNEIRNAGNHSIDFNASALSSGTYFYRIESGNFRDVKKMMLLK